MEKALQAKSLSNRQLRLLDLMQRLNFGRVEGLVIRDSEPDFTKPPRVFRDVKFGGENGPHPKAGKGDFLLKEQVCDLFAQFERMGDGIVLCLEVKHGLPFRMTIEEEAT